MAWIMAEWWRLEKAAWMSIERMALSWSWSRRVCVSLWSSSAPLGRPMAYWCVPRVLVIDWVVCLVMAVAMIRRGTVPQAIGRIFPLGFRRGMTRAEARALRVSGSTWAVAR